MSGDVGGERVPRRAGDREEVEILINGEASRARRGEVVLAALLARGHVAVSKDLAGRIGGAYCGMGVCFACNVVVDGERCRACMVTVRAGMSVRTCVSLGDLLMERRAESAVAGGDDAG